MLKLGENAGRRIGELPYGRQRLVEIAIALGLQPRVLLLDEPAAGIPSAESHILLDAIATHRVADRPGIRGFVMGCYPNGTLDIYVESIGFTNVHLQTMGRLAAEFGCSPETLAHFFRSRRAGE